MWEAKILEAIESDEWRYLLKGIPLVLIATRDYVLDWVEIRDIVRGSSN